MLSKEIKHLEIFPDSINREQFISFVKNVKNYYDHPPQLYGGQTLMVSNQNIPTSEAGPTELFGIPLKEGDPITSKVWIWAHSTVSDAELASK